ncbi:MAG: bacillithiol transferase BstA [Acidobacteriia bacterium]|nr:bacillithiol transferase BstA [Terriglobia bacterium]
MDNPDLRYPVGKFRFPETVSAEDRRQFVEQIAETPLRLRSAVKGLADPQLDTPYRPGGWTVRQVVHHVPDSHLNSYVRFRWALTEEEPTIKAYFEDRWAELPDARTAPVEISLRLLECLHARWVGLLRSLDDTQWKRTFRHPELGLISLEKNAALYAWHGRHHVAHITSLRERMGWKS